MEFGDIFYFILLVFFVILGFFNDSRKKKQQQQKQPEVASRPFTDEGQRKMAERGHEMRSPQRCCSVPPPAPIVHYPEKAILREFRSSVDLVSIHDEESSRSSFTFDYDADSLYDRTPDSPDAPDNNVQAEILKASVHPLIRDLRSHASREELKKGLIYGEIMQKKY